MSDENINVNEKEEAKVEAPAAPVQQEVADKPYDQRIEEARLDFHKAYKTSRTVSNVLMFGMVAAIVGIMFLVLSTVKALQITGYILAGVMVVGMVVYYTFNRNRLPNKTKVYIKTLTDSVNKEMFNDKDFSEIKIDPEEKLKMDDLVGDGVYSGASEVRSRNVVHGTYKGHHFLYAEAALVRPFNRKQQTPPLFVGRYVSVPNNMTFDGRFIFVWKNPKEPLDLPNNVEDLVVLEEKEDFMVYGPEGANYHQVIDNKIISQLNKIEVAEHLLNLNVVFWGGHTAAYISYDDTLMSVPLEKPFDRASFDKSFNDLLNCFRAITLE